MVECANDQPLNPFGEYMKECVKVFFILIISFYFVICVFGLMSGYHDSRVIWGIRECDHPTKGSHLIPTYRLGCYLGEPFNG